MHAPAPTPDTTTPRERLVRLPEVEQQTARKKSKIYADMNAGTFPKPVRLSRRCVAWLESEIQAWIARRIAESAEQGAVQK